MKKSLIALAALGTLAGASFAQSSVTVYGVLDASVESVKDDKARPADGTTSLTRLSSGNLVSSRIGFKGVEDLGSGLKGNFVLESSVNVDGGTSNATRFWDRSAWVGLAGSFGEVRVGRQDSSIGRLAGNSKILGAQAYDDFKIAGTFAGDGYRRVDNAINYFLPKLVDGLTAELQYSTAAGTSSAVGNETADVDTGKGYGLNVQYAAGPFGLGVGYLNFKSDAAGDFDDTAWLVYGSYDFGAAALTAYYNLDESEATEGAATYGKRKLYGIKLGVPVGGFYLSAGVSKAENTRFVEGADATIVAIKGTYSLSKRTSIYGLLTHISNDDRARLGINSATGLDALNAGENTHGIAVGVVHSF